MTSRSLPLGIAIWVVLSLQLQSCSEKTASRTFGPYPCGGKSTLTVASTSTFNYFSRMISTDKLDFKINDLVVARPKWFVNALDEVAIVEFPFDLEKLEPHAKGIYDGPTYEMLVISLVDKTETEQFVNCLNLNLSQFYAEWDTYLRKEFEDDTHTPKIKNIAMIKADAKLTLPKDIERKRTWKETLESYLMLLTGAGGLIRHQE